MKESVTNERQTAQNWSSRSLASRWKHEFFYLLIRFGGRWPAYLFSYVVVFCYVCFVPEVRRRSSHYIRRRFPAASSGAHWYHCWRLCQSLAISLIDKAAVGIRGPQEFTYSVEGLDTLQALRAEGRGLILLTSHTGPWQASMSGLSALDSPVHLMMLRAAGDVDSQYFEFQKRTNIHIIPVEDTMGSVIAVTSALKKNEIVAIMGDRIFPPTSYTASVDFLGQPALFPTAAYKIAKGTGAPVAMLLTRKIGHGHMELRVADAFRVTGTRGNDFSSYAQRVAQALEHYTKETPYQFYNFIDIWSSNDV